MNEIAVPRRAGGPYALFLLFCANLLNVADRALLGIVVDPVKADLALSDTQMSIVSGTAFVLFNLLIGIFIARWVDRGNRKWILVLGIALWSGATALTAFAHGFMSLVFTRVLVGVGEATCMPVAYSMIADLFVAPRRPRAIAIFQSSVFIGVVLGSILAGVLAAAHGWRAMFMICGLSGFVLVLLMMATMREPARVADAPAQETVADAGLIQAMLHLLRLPGFVSLSIGVGVATMVGGALPAWAPAFLLRSHDVPLAAVGALIGPTVGVGGVLGTLAAGMLATRLSRRHGSELPSLWVPIVALPLSVPFYVAFTMVGSLAVTMAAATAMNFLLATALGPCMAVAIGLAPARMRAISSTLILLISGVIGGALAPLVVGWVSDRMAPAFGADSLRYGLAVLAPTPVIASLFLWRAYVQARRRIPVSAAVAG